MDNPNSYKKFDQADKFLSKLWNLFPSFYGEIVDREKMRDDILNYLIKPVRDNSEEFCSLISSGNLNVEPFARGGFGEVGGMKINEDEKDQDVYAILVSLNPNGGFEPFYVPVILKKGIKPVEIFWDFEKINSPVGSVGRFSISDPITELIFGSMLGHVYDLGMTPFFSKYLGVFSCPDSQKNDVISMVTERASREFLQILSRKKNGSNFTNPWFVAIREDPDILLGLIFQFIYSVYIGKKYLGFTHFDTQHRNVMVTYTDRRAVNDPSLETIPYTYHGVDLEKKEYILIDLGYKLIDRPAYLAMKYNGIMTKIIDYGVSAAYMYSSGSERYKKDIIISPDDETLKNIGAYEAFFSSIDSSSKRNTIEIQYLLSNLQQFMDKGLDVSAHTGKIDKSARSDYKSIMDSLDLFTKHFYDDPSYPSITKYMDKNPDRKVKKTMRKDGKMKYDWVVRNHDSGIETKKMKDTIGLLKGMARYCGKIGHIKKYNNLQISKKKKKNVTLLYLESNTKNAVFDLNNSVLFSENQLGYAERMDQMVKFIDNQNVFESSCSRTNPNRNPEIIFDFNKIPKNERTIEEYSSLCDFHKDTANKYSPERTLSKKLMTPMFDHIDPRTGELHDSKEISHYEDSMLISDETGSLSIYNFQINPSALNLNPTGEGSLYYKSYQNWLNFKNVKDEKDGKPLETVHINVVSLKRNVRTRIEINHGDDLWNASLRRFRDEKSGVTLNGGYFTIQDNLIKGVTDHVISQKDVDNREPIGYFFDKNRVDMGTNGTRLPIPKPYRKFFGAIFSEDGKIYIEKHENFLSFHELFDEQLNYILENGDIYATTQTVIKMNTKHPLGNFPIPAKGNQRKMYDWAFCSGPILIWDGEVVFDLDIMLNEQFHITENDQPLLLDQEKPPNFTKYRLSENSAGDYMFRTRTSDDFYSAYGSKHSNRYMIHNVMAISKEGNVMFFLVEGRGYDAPGLDRVQLAHIIQKFNIERAISLDGGFSGNAVFKIDGKSRYFLQNDPEKRPLGLSISFIIG